MNESKSESSTDVSLHSIENSTIYAVNQLLSSIKIDLIDLSKYEGFYDNLLKKLTHTNICKTISQGILENISRFTRVDYFKFRNLIINGDLKAAKHCFTQFKIITDFLGTSLDEMIDGSSMEEVFERAVDIASRYDKMDYKSIMRKITYEVNEGNVKDIIWMKSFLKNHGFFPIREDVLETFWAVQNHHFEKAYENIKQCQDPKRYKIFNLDLKDTCCIYGDAETLKLLIEQSGELSQEYGYYLLLKAIKNGNTSAASLLIEKGTPVLSEKHKKDALTLASKRGNFEAVKLILQQYKSKKCIQSSAFFAAIANRHLEIADYLIAQGYSLNEADIAFKIACRNGDMELIKWLTDRGADIRNRFQSALMEACGNNQMEIINYLIDLGCAPKINSSVKTMEVLKLLIDRGANINEEFSYSVAFAVAIKNGLDDFKYLIDKGLDIRKYGQFALAYTCLYGQNDVVKYLAECGVPLNFTEYDLSLACKAGKANIVKMLIDLGVPTSESFVESFEYACENNIEEIVNIMIDHINLKSCPNVLASAVVHGHFNVAKLLIEKGVDIDHKDVISGNSALIIACEIQNLDIVKLLVENGANINIENQNRKTPFIVTCEIGNTEIARYLYEKGAIINTLDFVFSIEVICKANKYQMIDFLEEIGFNIAKYSVEMMKYSVINGSYETVKSLLNRKFNPNYGITYAIDGMQYAILKLLINEGANVKTDNLISQAYTNVSNHNATDAYYHKFDIIELLVMNGAQIITKGNNTLISACKKDDSKFIKFFIDNGADMNSKDRMGKAPLAYAFQKGNAEIINYLIKKGADISNYGSDALTWTILEKNYDFIDRFINQGLLAKEGVFLTDTPLQAAIAIQDINIIQRIINNDAIANKWNTEPKYLFYAITKGNINVVKLLVDNGADIFAKFRNKTTLEEACTQGKAEIVEHLIEKGFDIKESNTHSNAVALKEAISSKNLNTVKLLIEHGADLKKHGRNALRTALIVNDFSIAEFLINQGVDDINAVNLTLVAAGSHGNTSIVPLLLEKGADLNTTVGSNTALLKACENGHYQFAKLMIEKGADLNIADAKGITAVMEATINKHIDILELLIQNGANVDFKNSAGQCALQLTRNNHAFKLLACQSIDQQLVFSLLNAMKYKPSVLSMLIDIVKSNVQRGYSFAYTEFYISNVDPDIAFVLMEGGSHPYIEYPCDPDINMRRYIWRGFSNESISQADLLLATKRIFPNRKCAYILNGTKSHQSNSTEKPVENPVTGTSSAFTVRRNTTAQPKGNHWASRGKSSSFSQSKGLRKF